MDSVMRAAQQIALLALGRAWTLLGSRENPKRRIREMLENATESHTSGAPKKMAGHHFRREKPPL